MKLTPLLLFILLFLPFSKGSAQDLEQMAKADPFSIRGTVGIEFSYYNAKNKASSYDPFTFTFSGNPVTETSAIWRSPLSKIGKEGLVLEINSSKRFRAIGKLLVRA